MLGEMLIRYVAGVIVAALLTLGIVFGFQAVTGSAMPPGFAFLIGFALGALCVTAAFAVD